VKTLRWTICLIGLAVFVTLGSPLAQAQAEIDPDHYETVDAQSLPQSKTMAPVQVGKMRCEGNFLMPSSVRCNGSSLPSGQYLISVDSGGKALRITVDQRATRVRAEGSAQGQSRSRKRDRSVSVAEKKTP
jgi:hypothetical protein